MLTLREVVIEKPFRDRRYKEHRRKVVSALPRIDAQPPQSFPHLEVKLKKLRIERDRQGKICQDNIKLAHRMAVIMRTKRLDNINMAPKGPFAPRHRSRVSARPTPRGKGGVSDVGSEVRVGVVRSLLEEVTYEAERSVIPPPPGKKVQHRAPAGKCRVPRVGPPSPPRSPAPPRSKPRLPLVLPRPATPRSSPMPVYNIPTFVPPSPPTESYNTSSSAIGEDEENKSDEVRSDGDVQDEARSEKSEDVISDLDAHVSSILLTGHPDITISEPSDDEFYT